MLLQIPTDQKMAHYDSRATLPVHRARGEVPGTAGPVRAKLQRRINACARRQGEGQGSPRGSERVWQGNMSHAMRSVDGEHRWDHWVRRKLPFMLGNRGFSHWATRCAAGRCPAGLVAHPARLLAGNASDGGSWPPD
jgi:hypothetical protein